MYNNMHMPQNQMPHQQSFNGCSWAPNGQPGMVSFPDMNMSNGMHGNYGMHPMQNQQQQQQQQHQHQQQQFYNMHQMGMQRGGGGQQDMHRGGGQQDMQRGGGQQEMQSYMMSPMQPCIVVNGQPQPIVGPPCEQSFGSPPREMMMWP